MGASNSTPLFYGAVKFRAGGGGGCRRLGMQVLFSWESGGGCKHVSCKICVCYVCAGVRRLSEYRMDMFRFFRLSRVSYHLPSCVQYMFISPLYHSRTVAVQDETY